MRAGHPDGSRSSLWANIELSEAANVRACCGVSIMGFSTQVMRIQNTNSPHLLSWSPLLTVASLQMPSIQDSECSQRESCVSATEPLRLEGSSTQVQPKKNYWSSVFVAPWALSPWFLSNVPQMRLALFPEYLHLSQWHAQNAGALLTVPSPLLLGCSSSESGWPTRGVPRMRVFTF